MSDILGTRFQAAAKDESVARLYELFREKAFGDTLQGIKALRKTNDCPANHDWHLAILEMWSHYHAGSISKAIHAVDTHITDTKNKPNLFVLLELLEVFKQNSQTHLAQACNFADKVGIKYFPEDNNFVYLACLQNISLRNFDRAREIAQKIPEIKQRALNLGTIFVAAYSQQDNSDPIAGMIEKQAIIAIQNWFSTDNASKIGYSTKKINKMIRDGTDLGKNPTHSLIQHLIASRKLLAKQDPQSGVRRGRSSSAALEP